MNTRHVFGASDGVPRFFLGCKSCRRIVPLWRVVGHCKAVEETCRQCGTGRFGPIRIPEWRAAWWVLMRGYLWRKLIRRQSMWDPRLAYHETGARPS